MRLSQLFGKTLREVPAEADLASHQLLLRAGMISQVAAGVYSYLPLGWRVLRKIEKIIREEMDAAGGQEVNLPVLQPLELWEQSGRADVDVLFKLTDRRDRKMVLGPTHEEVITQLAGRFIQSYRDLPVSLYQIQVKLRDEPRPRGGLIREREFLMKDLYSFDTDEAGLDQSYEAMRRAYQNVFDRCGLPTMLVDADSGAIGGKDSREFMLLAESGEDQIVTCPDCGYAANQEKAVSVKAEVGGGDPLPVEEVGTPGMKSIEEVAGFLKVKPEQTLKAVFYVADGEFIFVVIRGDLEANDVKLTNTLKCADLRLATDAEVREAGIVAGAASAVGLNNIRTIADDSVQSGTNFVAGGNKPDVHIKNVNYPRDFTAEIVADIATAGAGDTCPQCGGTYEVKRGIEVGHIFKLGTKYSRAFGVDYLDEKGETRPVIMGCYGMGLSRLLAAIIEQNRDEKGIIWPVPIAPYHIYLCLLFPDNEEVAAEAEKLYRDLETAGFEVLFDDRAESPGVKFNDADLLGIPVRITVSPRNMQKNGVEVKKRTDKDAELVALDKVVDRLKEIIVL
jgi:prolyl-tRNA synthetase